MYIGIALIVTGIVWYVIHTIIYNHYLAKNAPELLEPKPAKSRSKSKRKKQRVTVVVTEGVTPTWVAIASVPPLPLFLLGLLITIVSIIIAG